MDNRTMLGNAACTGAVVAAVTTAVLAARGRRRGSAIAPINATSHVLWGDDAGAQDLASARYTAPGLAINAAACGFWAAIYEWTFGRSRSPAARAAGGPAVAALAYVTDYHVVPRRLTPGWELRLGKRDLAVVFAAIALALPVRALLQHR
jgi:hypothetical protein